MTKHDKSIKISLNIEVPLDGTAPEVNLLHSPAFAPGSKSNSISRPRSDLACRAYVNTQNQICVEGNALDDQNQPPQKVHARVYLLTNLPDPLPSSPDSPTAKTSPDKNAATNPRGFYHFDAVPLPAFTGTPMLAIVTWAEWQGYGSPPYTPAGVCFKATAPGPYTDCTYPYPYPHFGLASVSQSSSGSAALGPLPRAWQLKVQNFSGGNCGQFNGAWSLRLVGAPGQEIRYCNGGDGVSAPQIRLRCEQPFAPQWQVTFALDDKLVTYSLPADEFDSQARNVFPFAALLGLGEDEGIPAHISISPE